VKLFPAYSGQRFLSKRLFFARRSRNWPLQSKDWPPKVTGLRQQTGFEDPSPRSGHCVLAWSSPALRPLMLLSALRPGMFFAGIASDVLCGHHFLGCSSSISLIRRLIIIEKEEFTITRHNDSFGDKLSNEHALFLLWEL